jgi:hypothetical protein
MRKYHVSPVLSLRSVMTVKNAHLSDLLVEGEGGLVVRLLAQNIHL